LGEGPEVHYIAVGATPPAECPGTAREPVAEEGALCVFAEVELNAVGRISVSEDPTIGFNVFGEALAKGPILVRGTWAVTAK
jgi:hypothetical protein